jgi:large subunit ribosomal protein L29
MAILRPSDIVGKDDAELEGDLSELRKTLMKIRGGLASGGIPEDVGKVREIKKTIARILTIRHERKLGLSREHKPKKAALKVKEETKAEKQSPAKEAVQHVINATGKEESHKESIKKSKEPTEVTPKK